MELKPKLIYLPIFGPGTVQFDDPNELGFHYVDPWKFHTIHPDYRAAIMGQVILDFNGYEYNRTPSISTRYINNDTPIYTMDFYAPVYKYTASRKNMKWLWRTGWLNGPATKWNDHDLIGFLKVFWPESTDFKAEWIAEPKKDWPFEKENLDIDPNADYFSQQGD